MKEAEQYICDECGFVSPVHNDHCPECGAPIAALDGIEAHKEKIAGDDLADAEFNTDGTESLEKLKEQEDSDEAPDNYGNDE